MEVVNQLNGFVIRDIYGKHLQINGLVKEGRVQNVLNCKNDMKQKTE